MSTDSDESEPDLLLIIRPSDIAPHFNLNTLVGIDDQLDELRSVAAALSHADTLQELEFVEGGKVLLHGLPGTGKTTAVLGLAREAQLPVLMLQLTDVVHHLLGKTSKNLKVSFEKARNFNEPSIFFIDEIDALAKSRVSDEHSALKRAITTFNIEMDKTSLPTHHVLLMAATNHPEILDRAIWSRFDKVLEFPIPNSPAGRMGILERNLEKFNKVSDKIRLNLTKLSELSDETEGFTGRDLRKIVRIATYEALRRLDNNKDRPVSLIDEDLFHAKTVIEHAVDFETYTRDLSTKSPNAMALSNNNRDIIERFRTIQEYFSTIMNLTPWVIDFLLSKQNKNDNSRKIISTLSMHPDGLSKEEILRISGCSSRVLDHFYNRDLGALLLVQNPVSGKFQLILREKSQLALIRNLTEDIEAKLNSE